MERENILEAAMFDRRKVTPSLTPFEEGFGWEYLTNGECWKGIMTSGETKVVEANRAEKLL